MTYQVFQQSRFRKQIKKLHPNVKADVDVAVIKIAEHPAIGDRKKGDLSGLFVYKFHSQNQLYLLGYTVEDGLCLVYLEAISSHENFYRDLKK
jgi:mRNA-degrading endonuclease RelE of RelBE toxin-antitoxin system